jgi:predicted transcriptional regulator
VTPTAHVDLTEIAASLGLTIDEAAESVDRLVEQGWLRPLGNGIFGLTAPKGAAWKR